jgi:hypothetical protein
MRTIDAIRTTLAIAVLSVAACKGGSAPHPAQAAPPPAEMRVGEVRIIATVVDTMSLTPEIAKQYGIPRAEDTWMLLVATHRGPEGKEVAVHADVEARVRTLNGNSFAVPMRETQVAKHYADNIGTFAVTPPDTLHFTLQVKPQSAPGTTMTFTREVTP